MSESTCARCSKPTLASALTFVPNGEQLCRTCHAHYLAHTANRAERRGEEFRLCDTCGKALPPHIERGHSEQHENLSVGVIYRHYWCDACKKGFKLLGQLPLVILAFAAAATIVGTYQGYENADAESLIIAAVCGVVLLGVIGRDTMLKLRYKRR